jgi:CDP-diacylglycerol--serine O-phosphatidyltransferase
MVSSLPTFSGKEMGQKVSRNWVLPLLIIAIAAIGLLLSFPWQMLLALTFVYLASLPLGYRAWMRHKADDAAGRAKPEA